MLTRTVRLQLIAFTLIALLGVSYVALRYVGLQRLIGASGYTVTLELPNAGGIFTNAEIDYRGVPVGRVGDMRLTATGIAVDLDITSSLHIPASARAVVADRSVIGEQYVDLRPMSAVGPYLHDGSRLVSTAASLPPAIEGLLVSSDELVRSVPLNSLRTVVDEVYAASQNAGIDLQTLLDNTQSFFEAAGAKLTATTDLIFTSQTVLATQRSESSEITTFSANLALIAKQLVASDGDIRNVIVDAVPAADQVTGLIQDVHSSLGSLLSGLLTTSLVALKHQGALRELLVQLPVAVSIDGAVVTPDGINVGLVPTFFSPWPCVVGYGGTTERTGLNTAPAPALNTHAGCTAPTSTGIDLRGSQHAPTN